MAKLEARISCLETARPSRRTIDLVLASSQEDLKALDETTLIRFLCICANEGGPFILEKFRGRIDDEMIRRGYSAMRNYAFPPEIATNVRKLAGVIDKDGKVRKGYVLWENGCIIDASDASSSGDNRQ